jgi:hypothetical protein
MPEKRNLSLERATGDLLLGSFAELEFLVCIRSFVRCIKNNFAGFAPTKAAQRILAESMARELGPKGVHVADPAPSSQL